MEEIIKLVVDNGVSIACVVAFLYYVFKQQSQNEEVVKAMTQIYKNLALINEKLGIKIEKEK